MLTRKDRHFRHIYELVSFFPCFLILTSSFPIFRSFVFHHQNFYSFNTSFSFPFYVPFFSSCSFFPFHIIFIFLALLLLSLPIYLSTIYFFSFFCYLIPLPHFISRFHTESPLILHTKPLSFSFIYVYPEPTHRQPISSGFFTTTKIHVNQLVSTCSCGLTIERSNPQISFISHRQILYFYLIHSTKLQIDPKNSFRGRFYRDLKGIRPLAVAFLSREFYDRQR